MTNPPVSGIENNGAAVFYSTTSIPAAVFSFVADSLQPSLNQSLLSPLGFIYLFVPETEPLYRICPRAQMLFCCLLNHAFMSLETLSVP